MMHSASIPDFTLGRTLEIEFADFKPRLTFHPDQRLTIQVIAGDNAGFADTVNYEARWFSDTILVLSWRERPDCAVVYVLDLDSTDAYSLVTTSTGAFMRLQDRIRPVPTTRTRAFVH